MVSEPAHRSDPLPLWMLVRVGQGRPPSRVPCWRARCGRRVEPHADLRSASRRWDRMDARLSRPSREWTAPCHRSAWGRCARGVLGWRGNRPLRNGRKHRRGGTTRADGHHLCCARCASNRWRARVGDALLRFFPSAEPQRLARASHAWRPPDARPGTAADVDYPVALPRRLPIARSVLRSASARATRAAGPRVDCGNSTGSGLLAGGGELALGAGDRLRPARPAPAPRGGPDGRRRGLAAGRIPRPVRGPAADSAHRRGRLRACRADPLRDLARSRDGHAVHSSARARGIELRRDRRPTAPCTRRAGSPCSGSLSA